MNRREKRKLLEDLVESDRNDLKIAINSDRTTLESLYENKLRENSGLKRLAFELKLKIVELEMKLEEEQNTVRIITKRVADKIFKSNSKS